jgi:xanthine dehydrogenase accessory factor
MKLSTLQALRAARRAGQPVVLATWLQKDVQRLYTGAPAPLDAAAPTLAAQATPESAARTAPDSATRAAPESMAQVAPDSPTRAAPESMAQVAPDSPTRAAPESMALVAPDSPTRAAPESMAQVAPDSPTRTAPESMAQVAPPELAEAVARVLRADRAEVVASADGEVLLEPSNPPLRLLLVGAVHIAHPLAAMAQLAGFAVTIVDPRRAFATAARFPGLELVVRWPDEALRALAPDARTAVVTLTHDPKLDDPALEVALTTPAFYLGCLGSKKTHATRLERLSNAGFSERALARLHGPVGLSINARAPAEIAVSILAQIIAALRGAQP